MGVFGDILLVLFGIIIGYTIKEIHGNKNS